MKIELDWDAQTNQLNVSGPLNNVPLVVWLLERAKLVLMSQPVRQGAQIEVAEKIPGQRPSNGMPPRG